MINVPYRFIILVLSTACLSMMMANVLTLNFCIICMTTNDYRYNDKEIILDKVDESFRSNNFQEVPDDILMNFILEAEAKRFTRFYLNDSDKNAAQDITVLNITKSGTVRYRKRFLKKPADYDYNSFERSILFSAIAVGAAIAVMPISAGINFFGTRKTLTIVMTISGLATVLCPLAASFGINVFVLCRILQGVGFASCMPVIGSVTSTWARSTENGLFNGAMTSFIQIGPVITMPMSGFLCNSTARWPSVFYVHGALTAILGVLWWTYYRDIASRSMRVMEKELNTIAGERSTIEAIKGSRKLPLLQILRTKSVWAIWIASVGNMYSIQMVIVFAPTYISQILGLPITKVGMAAALPTFLQFVVKMVAGTSSDKISFLKETAKVRLFNTIAFVGMALGLILLACTPPSHPLLALSFLISSATILGFNTGGFFKSCTLIGKEYSYFINAVVQLIMCVAMLSVPFIVYGLTPNGLYSEWYSVFIIHAAMLIFTNALFCIFGEGVPAKFTASQKSTSAAFV